MKKPWESEPDRHSIQFKDGMSGFIRRQPDLLTLNGYVGIPLDLFQEDKDHTYYDVHGGVTFDSVCDMDGLGIEKFWVGFDCAHYGDFKPGLIEISKDLNLIALNSGTYRNFGFVKKQVYLLYKQIAKDYNLL